MRRISIFTLTIFLLTSSFFPKTVAQELNSFTPDGIQDFLKANPAVNSADKFLERLPREFKQHWIMMTRTESVQRPGDAKSPRFLLPSADSSKVFGFALNSELIEYLHFDKDAPNKFRFHLINMMDRTVVKDNTSCLSCHGDATAQIGRPNWDAYDSWAGMLPFNRDRIYENSEEAASIKRLLKDLRADPIFKQLEDPNGVDRNNELNPFTFEPPFGGNDLGRGTVTCDINGDRVDDANTVEAFFTRGPPVSYPDGESVCVQQGGRYLLLHHSGAVRPDEGRGVTVFDNFTRYNAQRVAQELLDSKEPVDIRPVSLAIARSCANLTDHTNYAPQETLDAFEDYHGMNFDQLLEDTRERRESLPKKKADAQAQNMDGLITANGGTPSPETVTQQVFRRSKEGFELDMLTECRIVGETDGCMIDREFDQEINGNETTTIALFRFFLEPPKVDPTTGMEVDESRVRVDLWSMNVRSSLSVVDRSQTYTFGDLFSTYTNQITSELKKVLENEGKIRKDLPDEALCDDLATASRTAFEGAIPPPPSPGAELSLQKQADRTVRLGDRLTYTISVRNAGPATATGVMITDQLPANVKFVSAPPDCQHRDGTVTCEIDDLQRGDRARLLITVQVTSPGEIINTATVAANEIDRHASNNTDTAVTTVR